MILNIFLAASASLFIVFPEIKKMQNRKMKAYKLKIISQALKQAQERLTIILHHICSYYFINQHLEEALLAARDAMNEAKDLTITLAKLQLETINSLYDWVSQSNKQVVYENDNPMLLF